MVIGTDTPVQFEDDHFDLFKAVGDQAVIALQNAQLYQRLEAEKQRLIEADEEARKELARDLHDGPTQSIAAIAMRLGFARTTIDQDPARAKQELQKVEALAKKTSAEIRSMLFTLRPLVLETQGLGVAWTAAPLQWTDGIEMLIGAENGNCWTSRPRSSPSPSWKRLSTTPASMPRPQQSKSASGRRRDCSSPPCATTASASTLTISTATTARAAAWAWSTCASGPSASTARCVSNRRPTPARR
jgi:hypothetical protein